MRTAIEAEARRSGAKLAGNYESDHSVTQYSQSSGTDEHQGRLWTEAPDLTHYEALCRAVKNGAVYDHESGLWVKRASRTAFHAYREATKKALTELVERNSKYAIEILGGRAGKG
jgi:hypothetical protein